MKGRPPKAPDDKASVIKSVRFTPTEWARFEHVRDARSLGSISALVLFWLDRDELSHGKFNGASSDARQARFVFANTAAPAEALEPITVPCAGCFADAGEGCEGVPKGAFHELRLAMADYARAHPEDDLNDPVVQEAVFERFAKTGDPDDVTFEADPDRTFATQRRAQDAAALELLRDGAYDPAELAHAARLVEAQARASINRLFHAGKLAMGNDQRYYAVGTGVVAAARGKRAKKRKPVPAREAAQKAPDPAPAKKRRKAAPPSRPAVKKGSARSRGRDGRAAPTKAAARKARPAARKARRKPST